jgi:hypothetical protein
MNKRLKRLFGGAGLGCHLHQSMAGRFQNVARVGLSALRCKLRAGQAPMPFAIALGLACTAPAKAGEPTTSGDVKMNAAQPAIVSDALEAAEWMSKRLSDIGYNGDFTVESLKDVDRFFDEQAPWGKPKPGGHLSHHFGMQMFALGAYVGETIRRAGNGQWQGNDSDEHPEITLAVKLKSGTTFWPTQRVVKRFENGYADSIYPYGVSILRG